MTPAEAEALGKRWIAAGGGWCEGMMATDGEGNSVRIYIADPHYPLAVRAGDARARPACGAIVGSGPEGGAWIDLRDGATKGAALDVVRERWGDPLATLALFAHDPPRWCVVNGRNNAQMFNHAPTEEEALVVALEAAPKEES